MLVYGETKMETGNLILNVRWPQRLLFEVWDRPSGETAYVWADCFLDAIETLADYLGRESNEDEMDGRGVYGEERIRVAAATDKANAEA